MTRGGRTTDALLFATAFVVTFAKVRFATPLGDIYLSDLSSSLFVLAYLASRIHARDWSVPRAAVVPAAFLAVFLFVFLVGFYNLETVADRDQYVKGLAKFAIHFAFIVVAVAYLARRAVGLYWQTLGWFVAGFTANAAYGALQRVLAETTGHNLDELFLGTLGLYESGGIGVYGIAAGETVYRTNALTLDPNHLGVMLVVPILIVFALYLRTEPGHRLRVPAALLVAFLFLIQLTTLSRSGLLGLGVGFLVLLIPYHHLIARPRVLVPLGGVAALIAAYAVSRSAFVSEVFAARTQTGGSAVSLHFEFYALIRPAFEAHPLFGMGLNTFSTYYEFLTGRTNFGPHSYYVALVTETGIAGALVFLAWLGYLFRRIVDLRRIGRRLAAAGDSAAARVSPLAWGLAAALVGTMAGNVFYLTMQMYYFFVFLLLAVAAPVVFSRR